MASHFSDRPANGHNGQDVHHPGNHEQERMLASQKCYETVGGQFIAEHPKLGEFMRDHPPLDDFYYLLGAQCEAPKGAAANLNPHMPYLSAEDDIYNK
jgi:hypothetical protein